MRNVPAPAYVGGEVVSVQNSSKGYGNSIRVKDANGNTWIYGHLDKINVKKGQQIAKGIPVGTMGDSGWATGVTLHLEARDPNNKPFDFALTS
jgi:murein DD-endopeptidase MepM/ murein hydrolase activator NlpD